MKKFINQLLLLILPVIAFAQQPVIQSDVVIIGGGTGGTAAAIQSARAGVKTVMVAETPWLGGMLTAAGVGCTDGNHRLPSGIWNELREACYKHYGTRNLATGWVSNFNFEPHVGDSIFKSMADALPNLTILYSHQLLGVKMNATKTAIQEVQVRDAQNVQKTIKGKIFIDATDLGDLLAKSGAAYDKGLEADSLWGEVLGVKKSTGVIQDITYAAILKDYGKGTDKTIPKPANYDPKEFDCTCNEFCTDSKKLYSNVDAQKMLDYGKLPNGKYMINWPSNGNDFYADMIEASPAERTLMLEQAKQKTLRYVYYIQTQLGFKHLGLADDEFKTMDQMPFIAYHREGRRVRGLVRFTIPHIMDPYNPKHPPLYRTGISVGDYPIDHHHREYKGEFPELHFPKVPSYAIPAGSLIPQKITNLVVCDKPISVSNGANGTTRLQPVVMLTGQAAGMLAAMSARMNSAPAKIQVRHLQQALLRQKVMLMPLIDVPPTDQDFELVQKIAATGILQAFGKPFAWANQTWFYPDSTVSGEELKNGVETFFGMKFAGASVQPGPLTGGAALDLLTAFFRQKSGRPLPATLEAEWKQKFAAELNKPVSRRKLAMMIEEIFHPFDMPIGYDGRLQ